MAELGPLLWCLPLATYLLANIKLLKDVNQVCPPAFRSQKRNGGNHVLLFTRSISQSARAAR
jgi:hypothetical protein